MLIGRFGNRARNRFVFKPSIFFAFFRAIQAVITKVLPFS